LRTSLNLGRDRLVDRGVENDLDQIRCLSKPSENWIVDVCPNGDVDLLSVRYNLVPKFVA
jgi:hypothetical protein